MIGITEISDNDAFGPLRKVILIKNILIGMIKIIKPTNEHKITIKEPIKS